MQALAGIHHTISEDSTAWYTSVATGDCGCDNITGAKAPICLATVAGLKGVIDVFCGRHYKVEEITCEAMGAPNCKFAIHKIA
jgi:predicted hydrocarbon binding protein